MNSNIDIVKDELDLSEFSRRFFESNGAVLEQNQGITDALLPEELCTALGVEEYISLTPDTIQFGSSLLEKIVSMAGSKLPLLNVDLKFHYIKTQGFENLIKEQFEFHKCKPKITGAGETMTRYILLTCCFIAQSDEQKQGLIEFAFNLDTGALVPGMPGMMISVEKEYKTKSVISCSGEEITKIHSLVNLYGYDAIAVKLDDFIKSMNRRFKRDSRSLDEYYDALEKEMQESLLRTGASARLVEERKEKIAMLPNELSVKKKDLLSKYSIKIDFTPVAAMAVGTPCVKVFVTLIAGQKKHDIIMIYNPVTKQIDPIVCQSCGISTYSFGMCSSMHINCLSCLTKGCCLC